MSLHFKFKILVVVGNVDLTTRNHLALGLGILACRSFVWQLLVLEDHQHVTWRVFGFLFISFYFIVLFGCPALNLSFLT